MKNEVPFVRIVAVREDRTIGLMFDVWSNKARANQWINLKKENEIEIE